MGSRSESLRTSQTESLLRRHQKSGPGSLLAAGRIKVFTPRSRAPLAAGKTTTRRMPRRRLHQVAEFVRIQGFRNQNSYEFSYGEAQKRGTCDTRASEFILPY